MRLGLHSQLRRRWCPRGHKLTQPQQMRFEWCWLSLAVDVLSGRLFWRWQERLRSECVQETLGHWKEQGIGALVWDNAPAHTAKLVRSAGMALSFLPPFSPELNPAERVFEEVRRWVEGRVYDSLEAKVSAVESFLSELAGDAERVCRLAGWDWVVESLKERTNPVPQNTA
jgi:transposase